MTDGGQDGRLTLFTGALAVLLALWLPVKYEEYRGLEEVFTLFSLWAGLLYTVALHSRRTTGHRISLFPVLQAFMAVTGYTVLLEGAFILAVFLGCLVYGARIGYGTGRNLLESTRFSLTSLVSLRLAAVILHPLRDRILAGYPQAAIGLAATVCMVILFNWMVSVVIDTRASRRILGSIIPNMRSMVYPLLLVPFMIPAALEESMLTGNGWPWAIPVGVLAIMAVQSGITVLLDRARFSYSRCSFLEDEMGRHTRILLKTETPIAALRILSTFWFRASSPLFLRMTWRNVSFIIPTGAEPPSEEPLILVGEAGLRMEVWPTVSTPLDPERLEIFIAQTETVLTNLELRKRVGREGWQCLEAMVYSLDMTDRRQTGYSRRVADTTRRLGRRMGIQPSGLEDLEMAAMLHLAASMLAKAEEDWQETFSSVPARAQFQLPSVIVNGIRHMTENFDGTGSPDGLRGNAIPLVSRILRVASAFVTERERSSTKASLLELERRSGTIFDPVIVESLESMVREEAEGSSPEPRTPETGTVRKALGG